MCLVVSRRPPGMNIRGKSKTLKFFENVSLEHSARGRKSTTSTVGSRLRSFHCNVFRIESCYKRMQKESVKMKPSLLKCGVTNPSRCRFHAGSFPCLQWKTSLGGKGEGEVKEWTLDISGSEQL
jgi:hypothetical protein